MPYGIYTENIIIHSSSTRFVKYVFSFTLLVIIRCFYCSFFTFLNGFKFQSGASKRSAKRINDLIACGLSPSQQKLNFVFLSVLLAIVIIGEFMLGGVVYQKRSDMERYALKRMKYTISGYNQTGHEATRQSWNVLQSNIECCGIEGPEDWKQVTRSGELPVSCCYAIQIDQSCTEINSYVIGCLEKFKTNLQQINLIIFWFAVGFALVQISAVFLAFHYKLSIVHEEYEKI